VALADWLRSHAATLVGMESTGVYWEPVYYLFEKEFECWLLNAQHLRNVPGKDRRAGRRVDLPARRARARAPELRAAA
jgi:transposase